MFNQIITGDALQELRQIPDGCINCCITSPPYYGLRDYGVEGQIGLESSPQEYIGKLVEIFREVRRVLRQDGALWLNIGDSYATRSGSQPPTNTRNKCGHTAKHLPEGYKYKDLMGIPWMLAFALRADGWYLRQDIIWYKPNCMPESIHDRCTKSHEYIFLLSKSARYYFDAEAIRESRGNTASNSGTRNKRSVWSIATGQFKAAHYATFPERLVEPCILAGCPEGGIVLDPFLGSGTTAVVARKLGRGCIGIEINPEYCRMADERISQDLDGKWREFDDTVHTAVMDII